MKCLHNLTYAYPQVLCSICSTIAPDTAADAQGVWHEPAQASELCLRRCLRPSLILDLLPFFLKLPAQPLPAPYKAPVEAYSSF